MVVALVFYVLIIAAVVGLAYYAYTRHFKHLFHEEERYNETQDAVEDSLDTMNDELITQIKGAFNKKESNSGSTETK